MTKILDLIGHKYGLLTPVERTCERSGTSYKWKCVCDCGGVAFVASNNLRTGHIDNCGCLTSKKRLLSDSITHHMSRTIEYKTWARIKDRCHNPDNTSYESYGGRGIRVQDSWLDSFENFFEYLGKRPSSCHSIERIDNDRGYEEGNVRWATQKEQARNKGKYSSNKTGVSGVNLINKKNKDVDCWCYVATWYLDGGKQTNKVFSINKYGLLPAFALAVKCRSKQLDLLKQEQGYSEKHGEDRKYK